MRISDWSSDVCSSDLRQPRGAWLRARLAFLFQQAVERAAAAGDRAAGRHGQGAVVLQPAAQSEARDHAAQSGARNFPRRRSDHGRRISGRHRSEEHTSELQSLMRISYAVFSLKKKTNTKSLTK